MPSGFEPSSQRCSRLFQNRASRYGCLESISSTDQTPSRLTSWNTERLAKKVSKIPLTNAVAPNSLHTHRRGENLAQIHSMFGGDLFILISRLA